MLDFSWIIIFSMIILLCILFYFVISYRYCSKCKRIISRGPHHHCKYCNKGFRPKSKNNIYCSPLCRKKYYRQGRTQLYDLKRTKELKEHEGVLRALGRYEGVLSDGKIGIDEIFKIRNNNLDPKAKDYWDFVVTQNKCFLCTNGDLTLDFMEESIFISCNHCKVNWEISIAEDNQIVLNVAYYELLEGKEFKP